MDSIKTFPKFTLFFVFLMFLEIAGLTVIPTFHQVSKALIMASLIGFYISEERRQHNGFLLGLIFALLGDCFLLFNTDDFFKIGLVCFLIMQLGYSAAFNRKRRVPQYRDYIVPGILVLIGLAVLSLLWKDLGANKIFVVIYTIAIITMSIFAYLRHPKLRGYSILLTGVIFFIVSDALLGFNKFSSPLPYGQILVMVTYMIAQYLIVTGEVLSGMPHKKQQPKSDSAFARHNISKAG